MGCDDTLLDVYSGSILPAFLCTDLVGWLFYLDDHISITCVQGNEGHVCRFNFIHIVPFEICDFVVLFQNHVLYPSASVFDPCFKLLVLKRKMLV
jgi:hypothetical protein